MKSPVRRLYIKNVSNTTFTTKHWNGCTLERMIFCLMILACNSLCLNNFSSEKILYNKLYTHN